MAQLQALLDEAGNWQLVSDRSSVRFKNKTFWGLATVTGEFTEVRGAGQIAANGTVSGGLIIGAASLKTGIGKRDDHLRSADFFDVEEHPTIRVEVTGVEPAGTNTATVHATLTVRGTTQPLPMTATVDRLADGTVQLTAHTTVDRTTFGVSGNMAGMMPVNTTLLADVVFAKVD
ncbi:polyisoprenoid-binding protein YceI [Mycolicibacterium sp. BK634]|uniref:YceI family protein n=1 Tax=Mycobacteriaceae TaxID=1762 RepID=UPI00105B2148|nr:MULTISPECIES: YceI family protein [Mycobacteriaceae]MBB3753873.1 polyisoprenoid-binding protein YceI [Mycolicibacterium sp. BK634]TDO18234.1 polyisoprenoid-binding protein YceI [Mycobacterium sp. BK086]